MSDPSSDRDGRIRQAALRLKDKGTIRERFPLPAEGAMSVFLSGDGRLISWTKEIEDACRLAAFRFLCNSIPDGQAPRSLDPDLTIGDFLGWGVHPEDVALAFRNVFETPFDPKTLSPDTTLQDAIILILGNGAHPQMEVLQ